MITKKKGLYLGLLVSMLGIGNVMQAYYKIQIRNSTPFVVKFTLRFKARTAACQPNIQELGPGHIAEIEARGCIIDSLKALVFQKRHAGTMLEVPGTVIGEEAIEAIPYTLLKTGNSLFIINGPYISTKGTFYSVDRSTREKF